MLDVVMFLARSGIEFKRSGKEYVSVCCPFCSDTRFNGNIRTEGEPYYHCWICKGHRLSHYFKMIDVVLDPTTQLELQQHHQQIEGKDDLSIVLPEDKFHNIHKRYLIHRGYDVDILRQHYGVVGTLETGDATRFRLFFPIYKDRVLVGYIARTVVDDPVRYLCGGAVKDHLFEVRSQASYVVLCEGIFDALRFGKGAISGFGINITRQQLATLVALKKRVIILFDNENKATIAAYRLGNRLKEYGVPVRSFNVCANVGKKDLGECTSQEINEIRHELQLL